MKKSLALMLALIMVLCMIPTTAFAADIIDQKNSVSIYKGEPINYIFLRNFPGGSITKQENEEVTWQRLPRYTSKCARCRRVLVEAIPDYYCINPDKNIKIKNQEVIGEYGVRVASWKGNDVYNGDPCFEFYCKAAKAGETDVEVTYFYNYNYSGETGYCKCGNRVAVPAQTNWYQESVTFHVTCETQEPPKPENTPTPTPSTDPTPTPSTDPTPTPSIDPTPTPSTDPTPTPSTDPTPTPSTDPTQPPLDGNITIEVSKIWEDDIPGAQSITVGLYANGTKVDEKDITPSRDIWYHNFGQRPLEDDNGNPINYTVKEENVPGWTPYYWTAGPHNDQLIFYIYNVPTVNTREIKVTKKVSGDGADKAKYFDFKVTLLEYHDNAEVTDQPGYYPLGGTYTFGGVTFTNGVATFKLKDGESFEITGIPTHIYSNLPLQYKVEEIAPSGYTVKVNGSADSSINGAFTDAKTVEINFENIKESGTNPTPTPTPTPTPGGGNGGGHSHYYPTTTPVPVIVIPPKTGDMTIWQSILHFLGIR